MSRSRTCRALAAMAALGMVALSGCASPAQHEPPAYPDVTIDSGGTGDPVAAYTVIESELFVPHPTEWGGAYIDGDVLVVNTVARTPEEAETVLDELGVRNGVRIHASRISMAAYDQAIADIMADPSLEGKIASAGPDYSAEGLTLGIHGSDAGSLSVADIEAALAAGETGKAGLTIPVILEDGGEFYTDN